MALRAAGLKFYYLESKTIGPKSNYIKKSRRANIENLPASAKTTGPGHWTSDFDILWRSLVVELSHM